MIPDKTKFLQKINIGDPIHITSQNNLKGILNKGLKQSDGMYGEGVYHSTVLKTKTGNKFVPLLKGVGEDEIAVKLRIKNKEKYRHIDDEKFQGRFLEDIPIKDIEIFDPKTNDWIGLQVLKDNLEKYNYLIEPL